MKFRLWEIIVFISLIVLIIVLSFFNKSWVGISYINSSVLVVLLAFFINNRIFYITHIKKEYDNGIDLYFLELYNNNYITKEQLNIKDERIVNGYYKSFRKLRSINILLIIGSFLLIATVIYVLISLK